MPQKNRRSQVAHLARTALGWALLVVFLAMVALWTAIGFVPSLEDRLPEPLAAFGDVTAWWPILAGAVAGAGAAWALAPGFRAGGETAEGGGPSLRPWALAILGLSSLVLMFSAYWPCAGVQAPFWSALRHAAEAFEGYVAEPFGRAAGCPAEFPQPLMAGVLFGKTTLVLVAVLALAQIFRDTLDRFRARWARQVVVFSGVTDETIDMLRAVATAVTDRQTLVVLDGGPQLARAKEAAQDIRRAFARDRRHSRVIVLPLDAADADAVEAFVNSRGRRGIQAIYLVSPDSTSNLRALTSFLPSRNYLPAATEVPGRVVVRVDNPWHAEDWRRKQMVGRPGWLFDALSVREMAARHVVDRLKDRRIDYVVISGATSFSLAILAELSFEKRLDNFMTATSDAAKKDSPHPEQFEVFVARTPKVVLVGKQAQEVAEHFRDQLRRFGIDHTDEIVGIRESESTDTAMNRLIEEGYTPALIVDSEFEHDATFMAVRHPDWTIFDWDPSLRGLTDEPLLGQLWMVGPTLKPLPDFGLDIWDRMGAVQHMAYVYNSLDGQFDSKDANRKHGMWNSLSSFARESNIRSFAAFTRAVADLPDGPRRLGTDLGRGGSENESPIQSNQDFLFLAQREHESWLRHHEEYGFRWGKERKRRRHPDMVAWPDLSLDSREKDVNNVRMTDNLFRALGFILVKAS